MVGWRRGGGGGGGGQGIGGTGADVSSKIPEID